MQYLIISTYNSQQSYKRFKKLFKEYINENIGSISKEYFGIVEHLHIRFHTCLQNKM